MFRIARNILFVILLYPSISFAQQNCDFILEGRILDKDTNLPISGATIYLISTNKTYSSDGHGYFKITKLCKMDYTLRISSLGFKTEEQRIHLTSNQRHSIHLSHSDVILHDVEVIGHQQKLKTTASVNTITKEELAKSKGENLATILSNTAGVTMLQTGATIAKPVIHGMHSNRVLLVNNGIKQEDQQWGSEHAPEIDPFIASTIHVIKGAESVRYGAEAIGGVIRIEPAPLPIDGGLKGEIDWVGATNGRSNTGSVKLEGTIPQAKGLSWRAQGTYKKSGNIKTADYYLTNTGLKEVNYSAALSYRHPFATFEAYYSHFNTDIGIFSGAHIGSLNDLETRIQHGRPFEDGEFNYSILAPRQQVAHDLVKIKGHKDLENGAQLDLQYGFQRNARQEYDIRRGDRSNIPALNLALDAHSFDVSYAKINQNNLSSTVGLNSSAIVNNSIPGTFATPLIPNYDSFGIGAFVIERLIKQNYELEAGLRFDYKTLNAAGYDTNKEWYGGNHAYTNLSGSLGALWRINPSTNFRSNLGLAWRPPTVNELYSKGLHHSAASFENGDKNLRSEQGYKWINTFSTQKESYSLELSAYGHFIKDYIYLNPTGTFEESLRGAFPVFEYKQTDAVFYGMDVSAIIVLNEHLDYQIKGSLIRAKDQKEHRYLPLIPSDRISHRIRYETSNIGSFLEKSYLQAQYETVFKQTRYEANADFSPPPNTYSLLSLSAGSAFYIQNKKLSFQLSSNNVLNTLYKEYMNRFKYYAHEQGRTITLRLSYEF